MSVNAYLLQAAISQCVLAASHSVHERQSQYEISQDLTRRIHQDLQENASAEVSRLAKPDKAQLTASRRPTEEPPVPEGSFETTSGRRPDCSYVCPNFGELVLKEVRGKPALVSRADLDDVQRSCTSDQIPRPGMKSELESASLSWLRDPL